MYQPCPRCGGNAPNICDEKWPDRWWEDDMLGLMYQGHIPPSQRAAPWEAYYASVRNQYTQYYTVQQQPLRLDTEIKQHQPEIMQPANGALMTPPTTPGPERNIPRYSAVLPQTPQSTPVKQPSRPESWATESSLEYTPSTPASIEYTQQGTEGTAAEAAPETPTQRLIRQLRRIIFGQVY